jgi:hypothetical protein
MNPDFLLYTGFIDTASNKKEQPAIMQTASLLNSYIIAPMQLVVPSAVSAAVRMLITT